MRVLHLYAGNLYGGIERLLVTLAHERGHCPDMEPHFGVCFDGRLAEELRAEGVAVHVLGGVRFSRPWTVWRARRRLAALLTASRFDAVACHACWPHALFAATVREAGIALAFWAHDAPSGAHWLERRAARTPPDLVIANSAFTRAGIPRLFPGVASEVVYCPVPIPDDRGHAAARGAARAELGAGPDDVVLLLAARFEHCKGHAVLLDALALLRDVAAWQCWIAGGAQRPPEQLLADQLRGAADRAGVAGRVRFLGHRADVPRLMAGADVYCQPNVTPESFGITFVEALYAGVPVVTTAIGGGAEVVTADCGVRLPPGDPAALAAALRRLIADPPARAALGAAGPARARTLSDPAARLRQLRALLQARRAAGADARTVPGCPRVSQTSAGAAR